MTNFKDYLIPMSVNHKSITTQHSLAMPVVFLKILKKPKPGIPVPGIGSNSQETVADGKEH